MTRVLLAGFEPFADAPVNPSWDAVSLVARTWTGPAELITRELPVEFGRGAKRLLEHVVAHTPDIVIAVGVAEGRRAVTPERVAINLRDARIPDNRGRQPHGDPVVADGPAAYFTTLPIGEMVEAIRSIGVPAEQSLSAGAYVCNDTFYALQHHLRGLDVASGFIHVPATQDMNLGPDVFTLPVYRIANALRAALEAAITGPLPPDAVYHPAP